MSGHSFGAITTQMVMGQRTAHGNAPFADPRITAGIAMSPSPPQDGTSPEQAFGAIHLPCLLMTGTRDKALVGNADAASRMTVYPALPSGNKYELVLDGAEHEAFSDHALPAWAAQRNPNHHRAILATSTAFWDAWLLDDASAKAWLGGNGPRSVLQDADRWQSK